MAHRFGDNDASTLKALSAWLMEEMAIEASGKTNETTKARRLACDIKQRTFQVVYDVVIDALYAPEGDRDEHGG